MPDWPTVLAFCAAAFILIAIPGPSVLFSIGRALALGRTAGIVSVAGNTLGIFLIAVAAALGAATLRLEGHFLSLSTLAWGLAIGFLFGNIEGLGNFSGISNIPPVSIGSHALMLSAEIYYLILLSVVASLCACGASGVAGGSLLLIPLACNMFGIPNDIAMQVVAVGFIIGVLQDSCETALNSSTDVLFTAAACMAEDEQLAKNALRD